MDLRSELIKMSQSASARTLAGAVALVLFTIQWIAFLNNLHGDFTLAKAQHLESVQTTISNQINELNGHYSESGSLILPETAVGLVLQDESGAQLYQAGETADSQTVSNNPVKNFFIAKSSWNIQTDDAILISTAYIDTQSDITGLITKAIQLFFFAAFTSLIAAGVAMFAAFRLYLLPMERLISSLRKSREGSSEKTLPKLVEVPGRNHLKPLAQEINTLIQGQLDSAKLVKVKQQYLEFAAHHDPLTHLPNRLRFENALKATVQSAIDEGSCFAVFLVDLDNFKYFNDQYGHLIGDNMVTEVGNRLQSQISEADIVARLDGDEFAVLYKGLSEKSETEAVARRIMDVVSESYIYRGFTLKVAVSVGASRFPTDVVIDQDSESLGEEVVNNATVALQEAKGNGRGRYQLFTETMRSNLRARIDMERDLKIALQEEQFEVFYQPKINIKTKQVSGSEALVRWMHPEKGFISPEDFVPVAEETGLIIQLGAWILSTACHKTRELHALGYPGLNVAVNISAVQFTDGNLLPMVRGALDETGLNPGMLELEITESAVMHDPAEVIRSLHQLSEHGMKLAIDDFGTGYSSLAYLKKFPVDTLKIDKAFITDVSSDNDDVAIVEAVLGLGKHFNMKVVAEGIEDEAQLDFLREQGCETAQGYLISKPLNAAQYLEWLAQWPYGVQSYKEEPLDCDPLPLPKTGTDG